jgi:heptosyltransferase-2
MSFNPEKGFSELKKFNSIIKDYNYDYIFDLHNNIRTRYLLKGMSKRSISRIRKGKIKRAILIYTKLNFYDNIVPIPMRYLETGKLAGLEDDGLGLELFFTKQEEGSAKAKWPNHSSRQPYIIIAPGAGFYTKRWPIDYQKVLLVKMLKHFPHQLVLVGSDQEKEDFKFLEIDKKIVNLAGKLKLLETAALISKAALVMANDSGIMHMATAVNTPVVAIFGSTVRELGFFPFRGEDHVVEENSVKCRPCSHIGKKYCPKKHFKCMRDIQPDKVFNIIRSIVEN